MIEHAPMIFTLGTCNGDLPLIWERRETKEDLAVRIAHAETRHNAVYHPDLNWCDKNQSLIPFAGNANRTT